MTNKEKIERIKLNEKKIAELIKQRNKTMYQILRLYKKARESQNEQTD